MTTRFFVKAADAFVSHNTDAPIVCVVAFERGYYPIYTHATPEQLNKPEVTPEILEAAVAGSMFGWHTPAARAAARYAEAIEKAQALAANN